MELHPLLSYLPRVGDATQRNATKARTVPPLLLIWLEDGEQATHAHPRARYVVQQEEELVRYRSALVRLCSLAAPTDRFAQAKPSESTGLYVCQQQSSIRPSFSIRCRPVVSVCYTNGMLRL